MYLIMKFQGLAKVHWQLIANEKKMQMLKKEL